MKITTEISLELRDGLYTIYTHNGRDRWPVGAPARHIAIVTRLKNLGVKPEKIASLFVTVHERHKNALDSKLEQINRVVSKIM